MCSRDESPSQPPSPAPPSSRDDDDVLARADVPARAATRDGKARGGSATVATSAAASAATSAAASAATSAAASAATSAAASAATSAAACSASSTAARHPLLWYARWCARGRWRVQYFRGASPPHGTLFGRRRSLALGIDFDRPSCALCRHVHSLYFWRCDLMLRRVGAFSPCWSMIWAMASKPQATAASMVEVG
jgi:hypothetical protein